MEVDSHFPPLTLKKEGFSEWTHKIENEICLVAIQKLPNLDGILGNFHF